MVATLKSPTIRKSLARPRSSRFAGGTAVEHLQYSYNRASSRTSRHEALHSGNDELYSYDMLQRLVDMSRGDLETVPWNGRLRGIFTDGANADWTSNGTLLFKGAYAAFMSPAYLTTSGVLGISSGYLNIGLIDANGHNYSSLIEDAAGHPAPDGMVVIVNNTRNEYIYGTVSDNGTYGAGGPGVPPYLFESVNFNSVVGDSSSWVDGNDLTLYYFAGATSVSMGDPTPATFVLSLADAGAAIPNGGTWQVGDSSVAYDAAPSPTGWTGDGASLVDIFNGTPLTLTSTVTGSGQSPPLLSTSNITMLGAASVSSANFAQSWQLDATGNWPNFRQLDTLTSSNNLDQQRASNAANEITAVAQRYGAVWAQPAYDRTGCMTTIPKGTTPTTAMTGVYDAWNRLVSVNTGGGTVTYGYDGLNRRITKTTGGTTRHAYYTAQWQNVEERVDSSTTPDRQFVWGLRYIDDLVCRERSTTGTLNERLYAIQDANWNVTAVVNTSGVVQQRYRYSPYGVLTILNPDFTPWTSTDTIQLEYLYCGYRWDSESGMYKARRRDLNPQLGCWLMVDPVGYAGSFSPHEYCSCGPTNATDPLGLDNWSTVNIVAKSYINGIPRLGKFNEGLLMTLDPDLTSYPRKAPYGANVNLSLFSIIASQLSAFNQLPTDDAKDGLYRLYTRVTIEFCCDNNELVDAYIASKDQDGGREGPGIYGTIHLTNLKISRESTSKISVGWTGWGRPNAAAEPGMQLVLPRISTNIWHAPRIVVSCSDGKGTSRADSFIGSAFPSRSLWIDGMLAIRVDQDSLARLWTSEPGFPTFVGQK